jgi:repressor LexA
MTATAMYRGHAPVTLRQLEVLEYLHHHQARNGFAPTIRELSLHFGWTVGNAAKDHLLALQRKGLVDWVPNRARTVQLTHAGRSFLGGAR